MSTAHEQSSQRWLGLGLLAALLGAGLCAGAAWSKPGILWRAYLLGIIPCWFACVGATGLLALGNLTGGKWATAARPYYLAVMKLMPLAALLLIPLAFGLEHIYPWATASAESGLEFSPAKAAYLSAPFFLARAAGYLVVCVLLAWWVGTVSRLELSPGSTLAMRRAGALSLVLLVPTATFAAFDWVMSLEPHWYSSIYGAILIAGGVLTAHALALIGVAATHGCSSNDEGSRWADVCGDLGNLTLAFVMVWTYFSFAQFLIIWSANLPSEIVWYQRRLTGGWQYMALALPACCFAIPFFLLLSRDLKRNMRQLSGVAAFLLAAYALNMYWTIVPAFPRAAIAEHVAYVGALIAFLGLWLALYSWQLGRTAILLPSKPE